MPTNPITTSNPDLETPELHDWEAAYRRLQPLFYKALARLTRQGFVIPPSDFQDMVHDFFVEAWPGVARRFDPSISSFEAYCYTAFIYFARPKIIRLHRVYHHLANPTLMLNLRAPDESSPPEMLHDRKLMLKAIRSLPDLHQKVLTAYCFLNLSERALCRDFGISRYRMRDLLIEALGAVVAALDRPVQMSEADWRIAKVLWCEQRSVAETARSLGLTDAQVRAASRRNAKLVSEVLTQYHKSSKTERTYAMGAVDGSVIDVLKRTIASPGNVDLLEQVRLHASQILNQLSASDATDPLEGMELKDLDHSWVAEVYETIATQLETVLSAADSTLVGVLMQEKATVEADIGTAFDQALLQNLPAYLCSAEKAFCDIAPVADEVYSTLIRAESVVSEKSRDFARVGITPVNILSATECITRYLMRLMRRGSLNQSRPIVLCVEDAIDEHDSQSVSFFTLAEEIALVLESPVETTESLLRWLIAVAQFKPLIFPKFTAEVRGICVLLAPCETDFDDLIVRWGRSSDAAEDEHGDTAPIEPGSGTHAVR